MASSDSERRPVVGVVASEEPATTGPWTRTFVLLLREYADAVARAGAVPVLLVPRGDSAAVRAALERVDGLLLTGGADVDPGHYGAPRHPETQKPRTERDRFEIEAVRVAIRSGLPLLAICRGAQLLNVALGGTLHQHLPDVPGSDRHQGAPGQHVPVKVATAAGAMVAGIVGPAVEVPCHHHQSIDGLGDGLRAVAWAADGTVEAVEHAGHPFVLGVQWHPEEGDDPRLFEALVAAARAWAEAHRR